MLSLEQNCEVYILRMGIPLGEWTKCTQGKTLKEKNRAFLMNRTCGDMSRVMASYASNCAAMATYSFGKFAALCGSCDLMQKFLIQKREFTCPPKLLYLCIAGSSISGDKECLEMCMQMWDYLSSLVSIVTESTIQSRMDLQLELELELHLLLISYFIDFPKLKHIHSSTFEWLSSRWSTADILSFIDDLPMHYLEVPYFGELWPCCNLQDTSNASMLMSYFSYAGALKGVQWLDGMGVRSTSALLNGILSGHTEILEHLLSNHNISMCDAALTFILSRSSYSTMVWCLDKSIIKRSNEWISRCIKWEDFILLQAILIRR